MAKLSKQNPFKIHVAQSILYGNYKPFRPIVDVIKKLIPEHLDRIAKQVDLPAKVNINIRPIKGNVRGRAVFETSSVEVDPRYSFKDFISTLVHECVHIEQHFQGRLKWFNTVKYWKGEEVKMGSTFDAYWNLPWEVEARDKSDLYLSSVRVGNVFYRHLPKDVKDAHKSVDKSDEGVVKRLNRKVRLPFKR